MSGGTPVGGGGYIRQRHSQCYASGGDDLEDDACSRSQPFALDSPRSKTTPLYFGLMGIAVNIIIIIYESMLSWSMRRFDEKWELWSISALPFITLLGLISFCLFSFALWPIWGFLTLPLLFTLLMACLVVFPHLMIIKFRPQNDEFCIID